MKTTDFVKMGLEMSKNLAMGLITDMKDAPLTSPTPKGGNHPLWVLGHLAYGEANITNDLILGETNPLAEWKDIFGGGTEPVTDADHYPPFDDLAAKFEEVRARTLSLLNGLTDDDLDKPSKGCPDDLKDFFGTVGQCFLVLALHPMMHHGQVADARRAIGRKPMM